MHADHPDAPHHKELKAYQRRRGVNHMQIFLEQLVSEILETSSGANHSIKKLHNGPAPTRGASGRDRCYCCQLWARVLTTRRCFFAQCGACWTV